jgi:GTP-binding protein
VLVILLELGPLAADRPEEQYRVLLDELGRYQTGLLDRPRLVVGSKADMVGSDSTGPEPSELCDLCVSAVTGLGIPELVGRLAVLVEAARAAQPVAATAATVTHRPVPDGFIVSREDDGSFRVSGRAVERTVALNDVTTDEAADYVQVRLRRLGVDRALVRAGAREGAVVHIGEVSLVWSSDEPQASAAGRSRRPR